MKYRSLLLATVTAVGMVACDSNSEKITYRGGEQASGVEDLSDIRPYSADSRYAQALTDCIGEGERQYTCTLEELPFLGMEAGGVSDSYIRERLMVSHTWMGDRFMEVIQSFPEEAKQMFGSVTAIVIDADIRPSYYYPLSGAIYLDPADLWLTNAEKQTVTKGSDYRSNYGASLSLKSSWREVKDNDYAYDDYSLNDATERTLPDIVYPVMSLLFHELTHSIDFMPADQMASVDRAQTVYDAIVAVEGNWLSDRLYLDSALTSQELFNLGEVLYVGTTPTNAQRAMTADYAGGLFANDGANEMYAYSSQYEDLAMLLEASLMKRYFNVDLDTAFLRKPVDESTATCSDYLVGWGERNRIANPLVKNRAQAAAQMVLPSLSWDQFFQTEIGQSTAMVVGNSWCDNLVLSAANVGGVRSAVRPIGERIRQRDLEPHRH